MLILALDTTTRGGSVAVTEDDRLLALVHGDASRTHGERLPGEIDRAVGAAGITPAALQLLAVASGPGAFTGLRIGLAAVQGLAMVLGIPVVGVSALDALALIAGRSAMPGGHTIMAWMDAQRGEVFSAHYHHPRGGAEPPSPAAQAIVGSPEEVLALLRPDVLAGASFIGDGATRYRELIVKHTAGTARIIDTPSALAPAVAAIGRWLESTGAAGPPHALQPLYVRRSDAELARQRRTPA